MLQFAGVSSEGFTVNNPVARTRRTSWIARTDKFLYWHGVEPGHSRALDLVLMGIGFALQRQSETRYGNWHRSGGWYLLRSIVRSSALAARG